jgi:hypothetical protein
LVLANPLGVANFELAQGVRHKAQGEGILAIFINVNPDD